MAQSTMAQMIERSADARQKREAEADTLVSEIQKAREDLISKAAHLADLSNNLRAKARRNSDEASSSYVTFANAHLRLAGMLAQGARRTGSADRTIRAGREERDEARHAEALSKSRQNEVSESRRRTTGLSLSSSEAFDELYSEIIGTVKRV